MGQAQQEKCKTQTKKKGTCEFNEEKWCMLLMPKKDRGSPCRPNIGSGIVRWSMMRLLGGRIRSRLWRSL